MIAVIDNYDSFTYNLVQYLGTLGAELQVWRNDAVTVDDLLKRPVEGLVISPGPGEPRDAGISEDAIRALRRAGAGARGVPRPPGPRRGVRRPRGARAAPHARQDQPDPPPGRGLFAGLDNPFEATRYHSLIVERESLPDVLEIVAWTPEGEIMGLKHQSHESWGVQFHPESVLTRQGLRLIENFLTLCRQQRSARA